jgi:hypothetical protein
MYKWSPEERIRYPRRHETAEPRPSQEYWFDGETARPPNLGQDVRLSRNKARPLQIREDWQPVVRRIERPQVIYVMEEPTYTAAHHRPRRRSQHRSRHHLHRSGTEHEPSRKCWWPRSARTHIVYDNEEETYVQRHFDEDGYQSWGEGGHRRRSRGHDDVLGYSSSYCPAKRLHLPKNDRATKRGSRLGWIMEKLNTLQTGRNVQPLQRAVCHWARKGEAYA